jgi:hypothetical protein
MRISEERSLYRSEQYRERREIPLFLGRRMRAALLMRRACVARSELQLIAEARELALSVPAPVRLQVCVSLDGASAYIYAWMGPSTLNGEHGESNSPTRLSPIAAWTGISAGAEARYHYVVATDVEPEWEEEFNNWYRAEHMPALAAVPGNAGCARLRSLDGGPRYYACYDLTTPRALESDEWVAARHSLWSARMRPHFVNPRRIMFRTLLDERRTAFCI